MAALPKVARYIKNVGQSVVYASVDNIKEDMPNIAAIVDHESNKEVYKSIYQGIRDYKTTYSRAVKFVKSTKLYEAGTIAKNAAIEDIRSGKFYNKQRMAEIEDRVGAQMGYSLDDLEGGFDIDEGSSDMGLGAEDDITEGDNMIAGATMVASMKNAEMVSNTIIKTSEAQMKHTEASTNLLYSQNFKLFGELRTDLANFSTRGIQETAKTNTLLTTMADNQRKFYETATKSLQDIAGYLKESTEMSRNLYGQRQQESEKPSNKITITDLIDSNGVLDLKEYGKLIARNTKNVVSEKTGGMLDMLNMGGDNVNMLAMFAANPLGEVLKMGLRGAMSKSLRKSMKDLDKTLGGVAATALARFTNMGKNDDWDANPLFKTIGQIFGVNTSVKSSLDPGKFEKGPVPFDGITRATINNAITGYLSRIEAALTGGPVRVYNPQTGKWTNARGLKKDYDSMKKSAISSGTSDMAELMANYIYNDKKYRAGSIGDRQRIEESFNGFINALYEKNGDFKLKSWDDYSDWGVASKDMFQLIAGAYVNASKNARGTRFGSAGSVMDAKASLNRRMEDLEKNNSIYNLLFSGAFDAKDLKYDQKYEEAPTTGLAVNVATFKDNKGHDMYFYLQNILDEVYRLRNASGGGGGVFNGLHYGNGKQFKELPSNIKNDHKQTEKEKYYANQASANTRYMEEIDKFIENGGTVYDLMEGGKLKAMMENLSEEERIKIRQRLMDSENAFQRAIYRQHFTVEDLNAKREAQNKDPLTGGVVNRFKQATLTEKLQMAVGALNKAAATPSKAAEDLITKADERIYEFFYGTETGEVDEEGNKIKGFMQLMSTRLNTEINKMTDFFEKHLFGKIKEKLGINEWGELIDKLGIKERLKNAKEGIFGRYDETTKTRSGGIFGDYIQNIKDTLKAADEKATEWVKDSFKSVTQPLRDKFKSKPTETEYRAEDFDADQYSTPVKPQNTYIKDFSKDKIGTIEKLKEDIYTDLSALKVPGAKSVLDCKTSKDAEAFKVSVEKILNSRTFKKRKGVNDRQSEFIIININLLIKLYKSLERYEQSSLAVAGKTNLTALSNSEKAEKAREAAIKTNRDKQAEANTFRSNYTENTEAIHKSNLEQDKKDFYRNQKIEADKLKDTRLAGDHRGSALDPLSGPIEKICKQLRIKSSSKEAEAIRIIVYDLVLNDPNYDAKHPGRLLNNLGVSAIYNELAKKGMTSAANKIEKIILDDFGNRDVTVSDFMKTDLEKTRQANRNMMNGVLNTSTDTNFFEKMFNKVNDTLKKILKVLAAANGVEVVDKGDSTEVKIDTTGNTSNIIQRIFGSGRESETEADSTGSEEPPRAAFGGYFAKAGTSALSKDEIYGRNGLYGKVPKTGVYNVKAGTTIYPTNKDKAIELAGEQKAIDKYIQSNAEANNAETMKVNGKTYIKRKIDGVEKWAREEAGKWYVLNEENIIDVKEFGKQVADTAASAIGQVKASYKGEAYTGVKIDNKNAKQLAAEIRQAAPEITVGTALGAAAGLLVGNPMLGAALGGAMTMTSASETAKTWLFGEQIKDAEGNVTGRKGGAIPKSVQDAFNKYAPDMAKHATVGGLLGLVTPFGLVGGALLGAAAGYVKTNEDAKLMLFGDATDPNSGIISKNARDKLKKIAPNLAIGTLAGVLAGPFGLVGNAVIGSGLGFLSTTEDFKDAVLGVPMKVGPNGEEIRVGGLVGTIRDDIITPIKDWGANFISKTQEFLSDEVFNPLSEAFKPILKEITHTGVALVKMIPNALSTIYGMSSNTPIAATLHSILNPVGKFAGGVTNIAGKVAKGAILAPVTAISAIGNKFREKQIKGGYADYMTAQERVDYRAANERKGFAAEFLGNKFGGKNDTYAAIDFKMATMNSEEIDAAMNLAKLAMGKGAYKGSVNAKRKMLKKSLYACFEKGTAKKIEALINKDRFSQAEQIMRTAPLISGISTDQREAVIKHMQDLSNDIKLLSTKDGQDTEARQNAVADLQKLGFKGLSLDNIDTFYKQLSSEQSYHKLNEAKLTPEQSHMENTITDATGSLLEQLKTINDTLVEKLDAINNTSEKQLEATEDNTESSERSDNTAITETKPSHLEGVGRVFVDEEAEELRKEAARKQDFMSRLSSGGAVFKDNERIASEAESSRMEEEAKKEANRKLSFLSNLSSAGRIFTDNDRVRAEELADKLKMQNAAGVEQDAERKDRFDKLLSSGDKLFSDSKFTVPKQKSNESIGQYIIRLKNLKSTVGEKEQALIDKKIREVSKADVVHKFDDNTNSVIDVKGGSAFRGRETEASSDKEKIFFDSDSNSVRVFRKNMLGDWKEVKSKSSNDANKKEEENQSNQANVFAKALSKLPLIGSKEEKGEKKESIFSKLLKGAGGLARKLLIPIGAITAVAAAGHAGNFIETKAIPFIKEAWVNKVRPWLQEKIGDKFDVVIEHFKNIPTYLHNAITGAFTWLNTNKDKVLTWYTDGIKYAAGYIQRGAEWIFSNLPTILAATVKNIIIPTFKGIISGVASWFKPKKVTNLADNIPTVTGTIEGDTATIAEANQAAKRLGVDGNIANSSTILGADIVNMPPIKTEISEDQKAISADLNAQFKEAKTEAEKAAIIKQAEENANMGARYTNSGELINHLDNSLMIKDKSGNTMIVDENGNVISSNDKSANTSTGGRITKGVVRSILTGSKGIISPALKVAGSAVKGIGSVGGVTAKVLGLGGVIGKTVGNGITVASDIAGDALKLAGTTWEYTPTNAESATKLAKGASNLVTKFIDVFSGALNKILNFGPVKALIRKFFATTITKEALNSKISTFVSGLAEKLGKYLKETIGSSKVGSMAANLSSTIAKLAGALNIAFIAVDFISGWNNAESILGVIDEATTYNITWFHRLLCGLLKLINGKLTLGLFPEEKLADLLIDYIYPFFDAEGAEELKNARRKSEEYLEEYNSENGVQYESISAYNKKDSIWTKTKSFFGGLVGKNSGDTVTKKYDVDTSTYVDLTDSPLTTGKFTPYTTNYGTGRAYQKDPRYANIPFNRSGDRSRQTIGDSGCGPAAAVNAVNYAYGTGNDLITAANTAKGYKELDGGTKPQFFDRYFKDNGLKANRLSGTGIEDSLRRGNPVVLMGKDSRGGLGTPYGPNPHYITAKGIDKDGNIIIDDPENPRSTAIYDKNRVLSHSSIAIGASKYGRGRWGKGPTDTEENKQIIWSFLKSKGYNDIAASAIMGNIAQECSYDYALTESGGKGPGVGICQWTYSTRKNAFLSAVPDWQNNLMGQLNFMWNEINSSYKKVLPENLNKATTVNEAVGIFHDVYEQSNDRKAFGNLSKRENYASQAYSQFTGSTPVNLPANTSSYTGVTTTNNTNTSSSSTLGQFGQALSNLFKSALAAEYGDTAFGAIFGSGSSNRTKYGMASDKQIQANTLTAGQKLLVGFSLLSWKDMSYEQMLMKSDAPTDKLNQALQASGITIPINEHKKRVKVLIKQYFNVDMDMLARFADRVGVYADFTLEQLQSQNSYLYNTLKLYARQALELDIGKRNIFTKATVGEICTKLGFKFSGEKLAPATMAGSDASESANPNITDTSTTSSTYISEDTTSSSSSGGIGSIFDIIKSAFYSAFDYTDKNTGEKKNLLAILGIGGSTSSNSTNTTHSTVSTVGGVTSTSSGVSGAMANNFPWYNQSDPQWGETPYGRSGTISSSGCGPTSMAMILKSYGNNLTPKDTAAWSQANGYRVENQGTSWGYFNGQGKLYGLTTKQSEPDKNFMLDNLRKGYPMISSMKPGDFTSGGHFIVLSGVDSSGNILVNDGAGTKGAARTAKPWSPDTIVSQSKQMWAFNKDGVGSIGNVTNTSSTLPEDDIDNYGTGSANVAKGYIASTFNDPTRASHNGVDIAAHKGEPIISNVNGEVIRSEYNETNGNMVVIRDGQGRLHTFEHLLAPGPKVGTRISSGSIIGYVGSTGRSSGNHVHMSVTDKNGQFVDPMTKKPAANTRPIGGDAGIDYTSLIKAVIEVLVTIADNTSKVDKLISILTGMADNTGTQPAVTPITANDTSVRDKLAKVLGSSNYSSMLKTDNVSNIVNMMSKIAVD